MSTTLALVLHTSNAAKLLSAGTRGTLLSNLRPMGRGKDFLGAWGCEDEPSVTSAFLLSPEAVCVYAGSSHPPLPALAAGVSRGVISDAELLYINTADRYCGAYTQGQDARFPIPRTRAEAAEALPEYLADFVGALVDLDAEPVPDMFDAGQGMWGDDDAPAPAETEADSWCAANLFASEEADYSEASDDDVMRAIEADTFEEDDDEEIARLFSDARLRDAEAHEAALGLDDEDDEDDEDDDEDDEDDEDDDDDR